MSGSSQRSVVSGSHVVEQGIPSLLGGLCEFRGVCPNLASITKTRSGRA